MTMKVSDLIERLRRYEPDAEVTIETGQCLESTKGELVSVRKMGERELNEMGIESGVVLA